MEEVKKKKFSFADYFFRGNINKEDYATVKPAVEASNRSILRLVSFVAVVFMFVMFLVSHLSGELMDMKWLYLAGAVFSAVILIINETLKELKNAPLVILIYLLISVLLLFGIIMGTAFSRDELSVTFIALLLIVPMLFADRPFRMVIFIILAALVFIWGVCRYKTGSARTVDITNAVVFGLLSCVAATLLMRLKYERFLYAEKSAILSELDLLTGLLNRNSFEQRLDCYKDKFHKSCACIYADANGLHTINDTKGHEAGDVLLKTIALHLQAAFGKENTFRVGGDEFIAFAIDCDESEIIERIEKAVAEVEADGYFVSVGYAIQDCDNLDLPALVKAAEAKMYVAKDAYYVRTGVTRRTQ